jgi:hypothetical protein
MALELNRRLLCYNADVYTTSKVRPEEFTHDRPGLMEVRRHTDCTDCS